MRVHYRNGDFTKAESLLLGVDLACGDRCSAQVKARLWVNLGVVQGVGKHEQTKAQASFKRALGLDPEAPVPTDELDEPTRASLERARKEAKWSPAPAVAAPVPVPAPAPVNIVAPAAPVALAPQLVATQTAVASQPLPNNVATGAAPPSTPTVPATASSSPVPINARLSPTHADNDRARFSGVRLVVEIVTSAVGGVAIGYGTLKGICGKEVCLGGALAALGAEVVATPVITYGAGRLMGGRGTFTSTITGAALALTVGGALTPQDPTTGLAIGMTLMPILAPISFEASSHANAKGDVPKATGLRVTPFAAPLRGASGMQGVLLGVTGRL
jgi:hypothetical protein